MLFFLPRLVFSWIKRGVKRGLKRPRRRRKQKKDSKAYEKALSTTTLDGKVLRRPRGVTHSLDTWNALLENVLVSPSEYYTMLLSSLEAKDITGLKTRYIYTKQAGFFSVKRKYLRLRHGRHVFDICCAPYGNGVFVSWWLGLSFSGLLGFISRRVFIGPLVVWIYCRFVSPPTYYRVDSARMLKTTVHKSILEVHSQLTDDPVELPQSDRPIMRDLYS